MEKCVNFIACIALITGQAKPFSSDVNPSFSLNRHKTNLNVIPAYALVKFTSVAPNLVPFLYPVLTLCLLSSLSNGSTLATRKSLRSLSFTITIKLIKPEIK